MIYEELIRIEQELSIELPIAYKEEAVNNPFSNKDISDMIYTCLLDDIEEILKLNKEIRANGYQNNNWPGKYYIFGYYKKGGYLFLNTQSKSAGIIYLVTSEGIFNPTKIGHLKHFSSFDKFIKNLKRLQKVSSA